MVHRYAYAHFDQRHHSAELLVDLVRLIVPSPLKSDGRYKQHGRLPTLFGEHFYAAETNGAGQSAEYL